MRTNPPTCTITMSKRKSARIRLCRLRMVTVRSTFMGGGGEADDSNGRPHEQSQDAARPRAPDTELAIEGQTCPLPPPSIARPSKVSDNRARFSQLDRHATLPWMGTCAAELSVKLPRRERRNCLRCAR